ncbi:MAG: ABC transporter ATP-binding protein/permease [Candidatus Thermoplasmatota archaeon]|nr:ABC transporter ATP-binding protein/permease [Candidatus Thermoplasmatota archaeon]MCL5790509.1 ABC transporter ATP-binding protein/permease [Candidatus Thermoplasmatota archaeon]
MSHNNFFSKITGVLQPLIFSLKYLKGKRWIIYILIISAALSTASRLYVPIVIGLIIDSLEAKAFSAILPAIELIMLLAGVSAVSTFITNFGSQYSSQIYAYNLRKKLVNSLTKKKVKFFQGNSSGDLLSRTTMDVDATRNFLMNTLSQLIPTIMIIIFALIYLSFLNFFYALFFLFTVPVLVYIGIIFQRKQRKHWMNIRKQYGEMTERLQEDINGQRTVRTYSLEDSQIAKFQDTTDSYFNEYMEIAHLRGFYNNLMPFIISLAATGVILYGGYTSIIARSQVGNLVAAVNIFNLVTMPISFLGRLIVWSENARAGIGRINEVLKDDMDEELTTSGNFPGENDVELRNIKIIKGKKEIISNLNMKIPRGGFVCITGETGCGKSSIVNLIPRLEEPTAGEVFIGGIDVREIPLDTLRKNVSIVPQEINLLSGTIEENIIFGRSAISHEAVIKAAKIARIDDFIDSLEDGYETLIGERGLTLSGGQRQRMAIARAIVTTPSILILDDVTSSVDPETELNIFSEIVKNVKGITVILVSLRYSAMKYSNETYIIKDGQAEILEDLESLDIFGYGDSR